MDGNLLDARCTHYCVLNMYNVYVADKVIIFYNHIYIHKFACVYIYLVCYFYQTSNYNCRSPTSCGYDSPAVVVRCDAPPVVRCDAPAS